MTAEQEVNFSLDRKIIEDTAKLKQLFLAKGLPAVVADVMAEYEWDDAVIEDLLR